MSPRTTHCNHWCIRQHRRARSLVGRSNHERENRMSAVADINVLIIVGLRAVSVDRELAKVAADSPADGIALNMFDSLTELPRYRDTFDDSRNAEFCQRLADGCRRGRRGAHCDDLPRACSRSVHNAIDWLTRRSGPGWPSGQTARRDRPCFGLLQRCLVTSNGGCRSHYWTRRHRVHHCFQLARGNQEARLRSARRPLK